MFDPFRWNPELDLSQRHNRALLMLDDDNEQSQFCLGIGTIGGGLRMSVGQIVVLGGMRGLM